MDTNTIISIIVGIVLVLGCGGLIYFKYKNSPKEEDKLKAKAFLEGLKDALYKKLMFIIKNFNYKEYTDLSELEVTIINDMINTCKEYIAVELEKSEDVLSVLALKCLTNDYIEKFIYALIDGNNVYEKIMEAAFANNEEIAAKNQKEDIELINQYSDDNEYNDAEMTELPKAEDTVYSEEELSKLNPQSDEEESYNADDSSMELVFEDELNDYVSEEDKSNSVEDTDDDIYFDANGRAHYKSTGKFAKTSSSN